ncbi:hypothetical protein O3M35_012450 [Rhynocoris fuscipes]|uniref:Uncharacterized protein n=1 Tax=Rhynocoris fuscipes TaxID=488301 RepID=A0AAW1CVW4_9HEMI
MKKELINLHNHLKYIQKSQLKNVENIVNRKVEEVKKRNSSENAEKCAKSIGRKLLNETAEKYKEATVGFIESCKNLWNMIQKREMNQMELKQTKLSLKEDGLFKIQINQTINAVNIYINKKIWDFDKKNSNQCY